MVRFDLPSPHGSTGPINAAQVMRELEELFATIDTNHDGQLELLEILGSDLS